MAAIFDKVATIIWYAVRRFIFASLIFADFASFDKSTKVRHREICLTLPSVKILEATI